ALFLGADEKIYGRYGSRDAESADRHLSLAGLRYAMQQALATHRRRKTEGSAESNLPPRTVEQYPAAKRLKENACIHCHQVYSFHRQDLQTNGTWRREDVWVYPLPENIGLTMQVDQGNRVEVVRGDSPAHHAGFRAGDI